MTISKWPASKRDELDKRLRDSHYGALDEHVEWARGEGLEAHRSGMHRYCRALMEADSSLGDSRARARALTAWPKSSERTLLEELGRLECRKAEIIDQLQGMRDTGTATPRESGAFAAQPSHPV
jgi:hypothetical protein